MIFFEKTALSPTQYIKMCKDLEACSPEDKAVPGQPNFDLEGSHQERAIHRRAETTEMVLHLLVSCGFGALLFGFYHVFG